MIVDVEGVLITSSFLIVSVTGSLGFVVGSEGLVVGSVGFVVGSVGFVVGSDAETVTENVAVFPPYVTVTVFVPAFDESKPLVVNPLLISLDEPSEYFAVSVRPFVSSFSPSA